MKHSAAFMGLGLCFACQSVPDVCAEICTKAKACGVLFSWLGGEKDACTRQCAETARSDGEALAAVFGSVSGCLEVSAGSAGRPEWCGNEFFDGCAEFVACLEGDVPILLDADNISDAGSNVFLTSVELRLMTGAVVDAPKDYLHTDDGQQLACASTYDCFPGLDTLCAGNPEISAPRLTFGAFCERFAVEALSIGLGERICQKEVCTISTVAEADPSPCADLLVFDHEVPAKFEVRVGPVVPFVRFSGPNPTSPDPAEPSSSCWQVFGMPMVATRFDLGAEMGVGSNMILRMPEIAEIEADPSLVFPCTAP